MATKVQKIMTQPINLIFRFLQSKQRIQIWLYDQVRTSDPVQSIVCLPGSLSHGMETDVRMQLHAACILTAHQMLLD